MWKGLGSGDEGSIIRVADEDWDGPIDVGEYMRAIIRTISLMYSLLFLLFFCQKVRVSGRARRMLQQVCQCRC